jgi:hypothetical protein
MTAVYPSLVNKTIVSMNAEEVVAGANYTLSTLPLNFAVANRIYHFKCLLFMKQDSPSSAYRLWITSGGTVTFLTGKATRSIRTSPTVQTLIDQIDYFTSTSQPTTDAQLNTSFPNAYFTAMYEGFIQLSVAGIANLVFNVDAGSNLRVQAGSFAEITAVG